MGRIFRNQDPDLDPDFKEWSEFDPYSSDPVFWRFKFWKRLSKFLEIHETSRQRKRSRVGLIKRAAQLRSWSHLFSCHDYADSYPFTKFYKCKYKFNVVCHHVLMKPVLKYRSQLNLYYQAGQIQINYTQININLYIFLGNIY